MSAKEAFLQDLKKETLHPGIPNDSDQVMFTVGVTVMRNHTQYYKPLKP